MHNPVPTRARLPRSLRQRQSCATCPSCQSNPSAHLCRLVKPFRRNRSRPILRQRPPLRTHQRHQAAELRAIGCQVMSRRLGPFRLAAARTPTPTGQVLRQARHCRRLSEDLSKAYRMQRPFSIFCAGCRAAPLAAEAAPSIPGQLRPDQNQEALFKFHRARIHPHHASLPWLQDKHSSHGQSHGHLPFQQPLLARSLPMSENEKSL